MITIKDHAFNSIESITLHTSCLAIGWTRLLKDCKRLKKLVFREFYHHPEIYKLDQKLVELGITNCCFQDTSNNGIRHLIANSESTLVHLKLCRLKKFIEIKEFVLNCKKLKSLKITCREDDTFDLAFVSDAVYQLDRLVLLQISCSKYSGFNEKTMTQICTFESKCQVLEVYLAGMSYNEIVCFRRIIGFSSLTIFDSN